MNEWSDRSRQERIKKVKHLHPTTYCQTFLGKVSCNYVGAGNLVNDQWWPLESVNDFQQVRFHTSFSRKSLVNCIDVSNLVNGQWGESRAIELALEIS